MATAGVNRLTRRKYRVRPVWWTRERVLEGLRRFYRDFKVAPTAMWEYHQLQKFTGQSQNGVGNPYPSFYGVLKHFPSFRDAWRAAGVKMNRREQPWSPEEDQFLAEAAGLLSRKDLAEALDRTPNAVHRRLYDLGLHSYRTQGLSMNRAEEMAGVVKGTLRRYTRSGVLPAVRGSKCIYIDPADLPLVEVIDWSEAPPELREMVRRSLMKRLVTLLARKLHAG
jgi:hypothetical protein